MMSSEFQEMAEPLAEWKKLDGQSSDDKHKTEDPWTGVRPLGHLSEAIGRWHHRLALICCSLSALPCLAINQSTNADDALDLAGKTGSSLDSSDGPAPLSLSRPLPLVQGQDVSQETLPALLLCR